MLGVGGVAHAPGPGLRYMELSHERGPLRLPRPGTAAALSPIAARSLRPGESPYDFPRVRELCTFTTHTPVEAGHDRFDYTLVERISATAVDLCDAEAAGRRGQAQHDAAGAEPVRLRERGRQAPRARSRRKMFPGYACMRSPTACIRPPGPAAALPSCTTSMFPAGATSRNCSSARTRIPNDAVWAAHQRGQAALVDKVQALTGVASGPGRCPSWASRGA